MQAQPPQAYVDAYWAEVAIELEEIHHAPQNAIPAAITEFRAHMSPARQTIYNSSPERVARTMVGHGYFPSVPAVGLGLKLVFKFTDPTKVLADAMAVAKSAAGLIDALSNLERAIGGEGLSMDGAEAYPGQVVVKLKPVNAVGVANRFKAIAEQVEQASRMATCGDEQLTKQLCLRQDAGEKVLAVPYYQAQAA